MLVKTVVLEVPNLYADHHVLEVRRILFDIPGVQDVYASSSFRVVEVTYDENLTNDSDISVKLEEAGYLGEWIVPTETGAKPVYESEGDKPFFRHTQVFENTRQVVSFTQNIGFSGRPLWPCPGLGVVQKKMEE
jgi:copper chaperone CopZ